MIYPILLNTNTNINTITTPENSPLIMLIEHSLSYLTTDFRFCLQRRA
jgi:hypothetical protein